MSDQLPLGLGWAFPPKFISAQAGPLIIGHETLIQQAISIVLNTLLGERALHSQYGSRLSNFCFNSVDVAVLADLKEEIANAIMLNEPRVTLKEIKYDSTDIYEGLLNIQLQYKINGRNEVSNMVFPYYLN
ncbi:MAG: GPW/gp25 family protein [Cycloclasticus sp.]|jgi:Phage baseplate assembly protein W